MFNGYVFCGEQIIQPDMLKEVDSKGRLLLEDGKGQKNTYDVKNTYRYRSSLKKIFDLMPFTEDENALKQYIVTHEENYSAIDSAESRVLSMLLDLELSVQSQGNQKEGEDNMCEAIRQMRESSKAEGKQEIIRNMLGKKLSLEEIADLTGVALDVVVEIADNQ